MNRLFTTAAILMSAFSAPTNASDPDCMQRPGIIDCFGADSAELTDRHLTAISDIADDIVLSFKRKHKTKDYVLLKGVGVPWPGSDPQAMAQKRATAVRDHLETLLIERGLIEGNIYFEEQSIVDSNPLIPNSNQHRRALNRRVEVIYERPEGLLGAILEPSSRDYLQSLHFKFNHLNLSDPVPQLSKRDITGIYHAQYKPNREDYRDNRIVMRINQAGRTIKVWYTRYYKTPEGTTSSHNSQGFGELLSEDDEWSTFKFKVSGDEIVRGNLKVSQSDSEKLNLISPTNNWTLKRQDNAPSHADYYRTTIENKKALKIAEIASKNPILSKELRSKVRIFVGNHKSGPKTFFKRLQKYSKNRAELSRSAMVKEIDNHYFNHIIKNTSIAHWHLANALILDRLGRITVNSNETARDILEQMCITEGKLLKSIIRTGSLCTPNKQFYWYKWEMDTAALNASKAHIGGEIHSGTFKVKKLAPKPWKKWQSYPMTLESLGVGLSKDTGSVGNTITKNKFFGIMKSKHEWKPHNFPGAFYIDGFDIIELKYVVDSASLFSHYRMSLFGDGTLSHLTGGVETSGTGISIGAGFKGYAGQIFKTKESEQSYLKKRRNQLRKLKIPVSQYSKKALHFDVDEAQLTNHGRKALARMLADQLASFKTDDLSLRVVGHTSPSGSVKHNKELSMARAINVLQAIEDVLGNKFQAHPKHTIVVGHGESKSAKALDDSNVEAPEWRKVDIKLDGVTLISLLSP